MASFRVGLSTLGGIDRTIPQEVIRHRAPSSPQFGQEWAELSAKQQLIDKLSHQLALFRRYLYGRRSEQLDPAQLLLEFASWCRR